MILLTIKILLCCLLLLPLGITAWELFFNPDALGANPVEKAIHQTGEWALRLLLMTLAVSPLRKIFHLHSLIKYRRMLGLLCFTYVCAHFSLYIVFEQYFSWADIWGDIQKRPYITVGFTAFVLLVLLAVTSNNKLQALLQNKWTVLHKLIYPISILAILHFWWKEKADYQEPLIYAIILAFLLGYRIYSYNTIKLYDEHN